ncbi:MAG TPA: preprotein translocase subunit YajC [Acidimicrobiales bacterium]
MEPLIVLAVTFALLWVLFILPQQRRVRAHQALVDSVGPGDRVILSAGIYGRIVELGPEDLTLEVAPGVRLRVARQAVLRRVEDATLDDAGDAAEDEGTAAGDRGGDDGATTATEADAGGGAPRDADSDDSGPAGAGPRE